MKFIEIDALPSARKEPGTAAPYHKLYDILDEFIKSDVKMVRIEFEFDEYSSVESARMSLRNCIANYKLPIRIHRREKTLYLSRRDL